jgi:hypothetical protein
MADISLRGVTRVISFQVGCTRTQLKDPPHRRMARWPLRLEEHTVGNQARLWHHIQSKSMKGLCLSAHTILDREMGIEAIFVG